MIEEDTNPGAGWVELRAGGAVVRVAPAARGRIASLAVDGLSLLAGPEGDDPNPLTWGSYPMVPWAGRIRRARFDFAGVRYAMPPTLAPHAIHGTGYTSPWSVVEVGERHAELVMALRAPWPFGGTARQRITLTEDGLTCRLGVEAGERAMPAVMGWHPWWRRRPGTGAELRLEIDWANAQKWERDADFVPDGRLGPVGTGPWDDCFSGVGAIRLVWPGALAITYEHDCDYVVVYDHPEHAVCVEPQTGPPDAFALVPEACVVPGGGARWATMTWKWDRGRTIG